MLKKINLRRIIMKKTNKIISALLSIVFIAAFSITSNDSILVFKNLSMSVSAETTSYGLEYSFNYNHTSISVAGYTGTSQTLTIPSTITENGVAYPVTYIQHYAFQNNTTLKRVYISENMESIGYCAFRGCSNLTYVSIPSSVTYIDSYVFGNCSKLTEVSFASNSKLRSIHVGAFEYCSSLVSIAIPDSVVYFYGNAFNGCTNLKTVSFNYLSSQLTDISDSCFKNCYNLTNITLPKNISSISGSAFQNCASLKSIIIPENVKYIYNNAFNGCTSLENVTFAGSASNDLTVCKTALQDLPALKSVTINKYKNINFQENTFANCPNLTTVNYPKATYNGKVINVLDGIALGNNCFLNTPYYTNNCTSGVYPSLVNRGSAKNCTGKQLVVSVFLNATINGTNQTWSDSEMTDKNQQVKTATDYIRTQGIRYGNYVNFENANTNSNLSLLIPNNNISITVPSSNTIWNITVNGTSKSLQTMLREQLQTYNMMPDTLKSQYSADGVSYVVFIEYNGRSSMMCLSDIDIVSLVRPGNSAADDTARSITHELMHCYGAPDIYGDSVAAYSQVKYYYDIMRVAGISLNSLNVNTYAAYCVGWTNTLLTEDAVAYDFS